MDTVETARHPALDLPFDTEAILAGLRPWVECESPTFDTAAVNRMMESPAACAGRCSARRSSASRAGWGSATASAPASRMPRQPARPACW